MRTVIVGTRPPEIEALIVKRRELGLDLFDELWHGEYHMNPAPHPRQSNLEHQLAVLLYPIARSFGLTPLGPINLGTEQNYRVPDAAYCRSMPSELFVPTAAVVVEILSPGDESMEKLPHYRDFGVSEVIVVDPMRQTVRVFRGADERADVTELGISAEWLEQRLVWPD